MATQFASITSNRYSAMHWVGSYTLLSQDPVANTSSIRLHGSLYDSNSEWADGYGSDWSTLKVDGTTVYSGSYRQYYGTTEKGHKDIVVTHNADGTFPSRSVTIYADSYHFNGQSATGYVTGIATIDRAAAVPTITITGTNANDFSFSVATDKNCNKWEWSIDGGTTWTTFSTTDGQSASATVTGLSPAATYLLTVRVTRTYNQVTSTASVSVDTKGFSVIDSISGGNVDNTITVTYHAFVTTYYNKIRYLQGTTVLATETIGLVNTITSRTHTSTYTFPASLLPTAVSGTITVELITYETSAYTTEIGRSAKTFTLTVPDTATYQPSATLALTPYNTNAWLNSNSLYVGGYTAINIAVTPSAGSGATVASVEVTRPEATTISTNNFRTEIQQSGSRTVNVLITDSRGRTKTVTDIVTFLYYSAPSISSYSVQRGTYSNGTWTSNDMGAHIRVTAYSSCSLTAQGNAVTLALTCDIGGTETSPDAHSGNYYYWTGTSTDNSYEVTITATDSVGTVTTLILTVSSVKVPFNLNVTQPSAAFGKVAELLKTLEIADDWFLHLGGINIPDDTKGNMVLGANADGTELEWKIPVSGNVAISYDANTGVLTITY